MRERCKLNGWCSGVALPLCGAALLLGCAEEEPPPEPYGARQLVETREFGRTLVDFDSTRTKLYSRQRQASGLDDIFMLDLATGKEQLVAEKVRWFAELGKPGAGNPTLFVLHQGDAEWVTLALRFPSGEKREFSRVNSTSIGWSDEFFAFIREVDSGGRHELWGGSFAEPRLLSADLYVDDWQLIGAETLALSARPTLATEAAIFRLDIASGELTEQFPASIESAEWLGDGEAPSLASDGLLQEIFDETTTVASLAGGCWSSTEPGRLQAADLRCYLLYTRSMRDGTKRGFIGLPHENRELALPDLTFSFESANARRPDAARSQNAPLIAWASMDLDDDLALMFNVWDAPNSRLVRCEVPWLPEGQFASGNDGATYLYGGSLITSGLEECIRSEVPGLAEATFSPKGSRLIWFLEGGLWTGTAEGKQARQVLADADFRALDFVDEDRLFGLKSDQDGLGMFGLDLSAPTTRLVPMVDQVFAYGPEFSKRLVLCGNSYNAQDRTGKLSLIDQSDLDDLVIEDIAESVADYAAGWPPASGADSFPFAYVRTSRFPSPRDGLWVGRIPRERVEPPQ